MIFKRSTRSIVAGKRSRQPKRCPEQEPDDAVFPGAEAGEMPHDAEINLEEKKFMERLNLPRWAFWAAAGTALVLLVIIIALVLSPGTAAGEGPVLPEIQSGQTVISVQADTALTELAGPGDIVQLYAADGTVVEELQYLQVYKPAADGCLLLLVDSEQAAAIVSREISTKVALICHDTAERADELLALQERICNPKVSLELQNEAVLAPGDYLELTLRTGIDPVEAVLPEIQWTSSDPDIVAVKDGVVYAIAVGQATVTAKCGNTEASCAVTVEVPLSEIRLNHQEAVLAVGESLTLTATPEPADTTNFDVTWSASDPAIATVSEDGTVTGVAPGTVVVTATCDGISAECTIRVGYHAEVVQLDRQTLALKIGQKSKLVPSIYPSADLIDTTEYVSSNPKVAAVAADGTVTAVAAGTAIITFRCGDATVKCTVTVTQ